MKWLLKVFCESSLARIRARARGFAGDRDGATAVEFALVAAPFFLLIFAILEIALIFFASAVIEEAVSAAARDIRTGKLQSSGGQEEDFRAIICDRVNTIADCSRLKVDVRTFENFANTQFTPPISNDGDLDESGFTFEPGGAQDIVVVRVFYDWPLLGPGMINGLANMPGNRRLISSATAFRNEPFEDD
jgi:Flp pilus assembly protein TadG